MRFEGYSPKTTETQFIMKLSPKLTRYDRGYMTVQETTDFWCQYWDTDKAVRALEDRESTRHKDLVTAQRERDEIQNRYLGLIGGRLWIAVKCTDSQDLFDALQARAIETVLWTPDAYPSSKEWLNWWFVTPPCGGTVFIGNPYLPIDNFDKLLEQAEFWRVLSWSLSPVSLFWNHGVSQIHGFARWEDGKLLRAVHTTQSTFYQKGQPLDVNR